MTESSVAYSSIADSAEAGAHLGATILDAFEEKSPDALIVFASSQHNYSHLLHALKDACQPQIMIGCSSAGEFINQMQGEHSACAIGLRSNEIQFRAGLGQQIGSQLEQAAQDIANSFAGVNTEPMLFHSALILTDALAGGADDLIERLNVFTGGSYRFFGGGAGDDARFQKTHVFYGTEVYTGAAVALEMLSRKPIGIGVRHGWQPASAPLRVTESAGMRLISLNSMPAVEALQEHAEATGQHFDLAQPLAFFLHNTIGIDSGTGYKLRVPLALHEDGSISCAAEIPEGMIVQFMRATVNSSAEAAASATQSALDQLQGNTPEVALFFDCVATRLRMGDKFGLEMTTLEQTLGGAKYAGCNTYGQVARAEGQFSGFHNCTAVVCVIPA